MAEYNKAQLTEMIVGKLLRNFGRTVDEATPNHMFKACAMVLRSGHQIETSNHVWEAQGRQVHYLSLEFLMGRSLEKNAYNLGLLDTLTQVLEDLGFSAADLFETEPDAGLGNGGLGRLAACYLQAEDHRRQAGGAGRQLAWPGRRLAYRQDGRGGGGPLWRQDRGPLGGRPQ